jgi:S-DNA-T family DNA segregation ATPase FtsK/SpoIIIE
MDIAAQLVRNRRGINRITGASLLVISLVSILSLISYSGSDITWNHEAGRAADTAVNYLGPLGATLADFLLQLFGTCAFILPLLMVSFGWDRIRHHDRQGYGRFLALLGVLLSLSVMLDVLYGTIGFRGEDYSAGGYFGLKLADVLRAVGSRFGAWLFATLGLAVSVVLVDRRAFMRCLEIVGRWMSLAYAALKERGSTMIDAFRERRQERLDSEADELDDSSTQPVAPRTRPTIQLQEDEGAETPTPRIPVVPRARASEKPAAPHQQLLPMKKGSKGFSLPPIDLLNEPEHQEIESEKELLARSNMITAKLGEFSVGGAVVAIHPGPVVTTFEFKPDAGIKYSKITSMTDDLSLALEAESVRIARMPGRSTIGIEVPNLQQETIFPRELLECKKFKAHRAKLALALGKDITGENYVAELERMPHLLIAGATGAGKSVGLNGMIVSLLYRMTPSDLRLIMIDTKMIELGVYADIPHLLIPVVTDPKKASTALKWAVREMEGRYRKLASVGVRNLQQYNELLEKEPDRSMPDPRTGEDIQLTPLPYIVIVIDEMADLLMVAAAEVEESVMRLAQMARAIGIHLILATQRPSVDVITGTIKANFPSRIAFRVSQRVDSRTIIDQQGAENLLGRGDMLFMPPGSSRVIRLHGPYITEAELSRITSYLKKAAEPEYDATVLTEQSEGRSGGDNGDLDDMYYDAVRCILQEGKCSITLIQRRLQLGYARAARIVDFMEQQGIVSAGEGSKAREILVGKDYLDSLDTGNDDNWQTP